MRYTNYTLNDFLQDEYFLQWVRKPNEETALFWEAWITNHPEKKGIVAKAKEFVLAMDFPESEAVSPTDQEFQEVFDRILKHSSGQELSHKNRFVVSSVSKPSSTGLFWRVAAVLFPAIVAGFVFWGFFEKEEQLPERPIVWVIKTAELGQRLTFVLPDGSNVKLNSGSSLRYPEQFMDTEREAFLKGEAYFDVQKDVVRPFTIHTQSLDIQVLGTSFNVKAFEGADETVALVSGKVKVKPQRDDVEAMELSPQEAAVFSEKDERITKRTLKKEDLYWYEKVIHFEGATFQEVIEILEHWYGVEFEVQKLPKHTQDLYGHFESQSIEKVLKGLSHSVGFHYLKTNEQIIIH